MLNMETVTDPFLEATPTNRVELADRVMYFNFNFPSSLRGLLKLVEICVCFIAMVLVGFSQPVGDERGFSFFLTFTGLIVAFALLVSYTVMLNTRIDANCWLMAEAIYNMIMSVAFTIAAIFMFLFNANYWADRNPDWQIVPAFASGALFACALVYVWDGLMLLIGKERYSWRPTTSAFEYSTKESVLPQ